MAKFQFQLVAGIHRDENKKQYKKGDIITTDRDLAAQFANKFILVTAPTPPVAPTTPAVVTTPTSNTETATDAAEGDLGDDVTDGYIDAIDAGLKVYTKGGWCSIIDPETNERLNASGLRASAVADFIEGHLAE